MPFPACSLAEENPRVLASWRCYPGADNASDNAWDLHEGLSLGPLSDEESKTGIPVRSWQKQRAARLVMFAW